jgi:hypothetical protein
VRCATVQGIGQRHEQQMREQVFAARDEEEHCPKYHRTGDYLTNPAAPEVDDCADQQDQQEALTLIHHNHDLPPSRSTSIHTYSPIAHPRCQTRD